MNAVFKKMNFKGQSPICVLEAPEAFAPAMAEMAATTEVQTALADGTAYTWLLGFCPDAAAIERLAPVAAAALAEDAIFYLAYPKKSSKRYQSDISRDQGWGPLGKLGFEPVRQVAIDADWSAMRFRKVAFIGELKRNEKMLLSGEAKQRRKQ